MDNAHRKLRNIERFGSRRAKVFAKRARKLGWTANSIVSALAYGFERRTTASRSAGE